MIQKLKEILQKIAPRLVHVAVAAGMIVAIVPGNSDRDQYLGKPLAGIEFYGIQNVDPTELRDTVPLTPGQEITLESLNAAVRSLYATGYFENVTLKAELTSDNRVLLNFELVELPRISDIELLGMEELYEADLKTALPVKEGDVYQLQRAQEAVAVLVDKYRSEGFFMAAVWLDTAEVDPETNTIELRYIIDEGESIPISRINILGTRNLDPENMLAILDHKEEGIFEDGIFSEGKFEEDKYKILAYAKSNGYVNAEIVPESTGYEIRWRNPSRPEEGRVVVITYKLNEGDIRFFGGYSLEHDSQAINLERNPPERKVKTKENQNPVFTEEQLLSFLEFNPGESGEIFDEGKFFRDRNTLQQAYSSQGYVFAQIQPYFTTFQLTEENLQKYEACRDLKNPASEDQKRCKDIGKSLDFEMLREKLADDPRAAGQTLRHVHFIVRENHLAFIENIIIKGMTKTQENVIRRELLVKEGQLFNSALVERSREKIFNLGYFKEVNLEMRPGSDDEKMNLIIDVTEQPTGTITMGGGYGTQTGFSIFTEVGENNLNGTGQRITGKLQYGPLTRQVSISWTDPWLYEACQDSTGRYWYNQQQRIDDAESLESLELLADNYQNQYSEVGKLIRMYVEEARTQPETIENLDRTKEKIRHVIRPFLEEEEDCYRSAPRPWALSLYAGYASSTVEIVPIQVSDDPNDFFERATYEVTSLGLGVGLSHTFWINWAHYHRYSPSWSIASRPSALASNEVIRRTNLGWQFKSSFTNGLLYDSRDNVYNTTSGLSMDLSIETVGQILGGQDHYNQYTAKFSHYFWPFDYTFGGLFRSNALKRWRVVIETRLSGTFTHETAPYNGNQNKDINPFIEPGDRLLIGGYETLRGYDFARDPNFPRPWWQLNGANHMILGGLEMRFPIEPSVLWWAFFLDAGSMFINLGELTGDNAEFVDNYEDEVEARFEGANAIDRYLADYINPVNQQPYFFGSQSAWNDPRRAVLSQRNLALDRALFSWGFGIRIQIPVLPLRLFLAQKLYYERGKLKPIPGDDRFNFVFGIGDFRF
ncbi:MAG: hypothetical protein CMN76_09310 [Spirochaetaceae bacterium]|nr:hypothetical protein [Spirochaetaceae bacterium]